MTKTLYLIEDEDYSYVVLATDREDEMSDWTRKIVLTDEEFAQYEDAREAMRAYNRLVGYLYERAVEIRPAPASSLTRTAEVLKTNWPDFAGWLLKVSRSEVCGHREDFATGDWQDACKLAYGHDGPHDYRREDSAPAP